MNIDSSENNEENKEKQIKPNKNRVNKLLSSSTVNIAMIEKDCLDSNIKINFKDLFNTLLKIDKNLSENIFEKLKIYRESLNYDNRYI